eukprot:1475999-Pyramimonas_sp.AAC.1
MCSCGRCIRVGFPVGQAAIRIVGCDASWASARAEPGMPARVCQVFSFPTRARRVFASPLAALLGARGGARNDRLEEAPTVCE